MMSSVRISQIDVMTPPRTVPTEPTERPWRQVLGNPAFIEQTDAEGRRGLIVADCSMTDEGAANAALIVAAVNAYNPTAAPPPPEDRLLAEAVRALGEACDRLVAEFGGISNTDDIESWDNEEAYLTYRDLDATLARLRTAQQPTKEGVVR